MNRFTDEKVMKGYALACADLIDRGHADLAVSLLRHEAEIGFEELSKLDLPRYDYQSLYEVLHDDMRKPCILSAHLQGRISEDEKQARAKVLADAKRRANDEAAA